MGEEHTQHELSPVDARVNDILSASSPKFLTDGLGLRGTPTVGLTSPTLSMPSAESVSFAEPSSTGFQLGGTGFDFSFPDARGGGSAFPFWDWSKTQTNPGGINPEYAYNIWFGKPRANSEYPSEVYTVSLFTSAEDEGITLDGTAVPRVTAYMANGAYANLGGDGMLSLRDAGANQLDLEATQISFSTGVTSSTLDSYGLEVTDGSNKADVSVAQVEASDGNGRSRLKPTLVQIIEGTDTGTYEADQLTLSPSSGRQLFASSEYVALKDGSEDRAVLGQVSGSGSLKCKSTIGGEGYYSTLAMHIKGGGGEEFRADTQGWTVEDSAGTNYTTASNSLVYAESPSGHASMDPAGFEVSDSPGNYASISKESITLYAVEGGSVTLNNSGGGTYLEVYNSETGKTRVSDGLIEITDIFSTKKVTIDVPSTGTTLVDATWKEIDICVNGVAKKMKVLGTDPYDPPA